MYKKNETRVSSTTTTKRKKKKDEQADRSVDTMNELRSTSVRSLEVRKRGNEVHSVQLSDGAEKREREKERKSPVIAQGTMDRLPSFLSSLKLAIPFFFSPYY